MTTDQPATTSETLRPAASAGGGVPPYRQTVATVLARYHSEAARGLTSVAAKEALATCGPNELPTVPPEPAWKRFLAQFENPLTGVLLLAATLISFVAWLIRRERDAPVPYEVLAILAIVLINGVRGYVQEHRAEQALAALQAMSAPQPACWFARGPGRHLLPTRELVPGDIRSSKRETRWPPTGVCWNRSLCALVKWP